MTEDKLLDKNNLLSQLDRHLDWIKSCDTKSSIVLAFVGIFLTIFTSGHSINTLNTIITHSVQNVSFCNILYLVLFILAWFIFLYGTYCLIRVLIPKLGKDAHTFDKNMHKDSLYYFEDISRNTFTEYKDKVSTRSDNDEIADILSQIYINSKISSSKYVSYSKGIKYISLGILSIIILYIIGFIIIKSGGF